MTRVRSWFFYAHLATGCIAGLVILTMSVTGALLAFQPQVLDWLEADARRVSAPAGAPRAEARTLLQAARSARPGDPVSSVALYADPRVAATVTFASGAVTFVDPISADVRGTGAGPARAFFRALVAWHRYLGASGDARPRARAVTGAANLAFLALAASGLLLWWPRRRSRQAFIAAAVPTFRAPRGARDRNWHQVAGFWMAPVIIVMTVTGAVMSYAWANRLVYLLAGSPPPRADRERPAPDRAFVVAADAPGAHRPKVGGPEARAPEAGGPEAGGTDPWLRLDEGWAEAAARMPTWESITARVTPRTGSSVTFVLTNAAHWNRFARSQLIMDAATGAVVRWAPYSEAAAGDKLRGWMRFAHTGELGGLVGQALAALGCLAGVGLVWTGLALAWRRAVAWGSRVARTAPGATETA